MSEEEPVIIEDSDVSDDDRRDILAEIDKIVEETRSGDSSTPQAVRPKKNGAGERGASRQLRPPQKEEIEGVFVSWRPRS